MTAHRFATCSILIALVTSQVGWLPLATGQVGGQVGSQPTAPGTGQAKKQSQPSATATLSVETYLDQVRQKNETFAAAQATAKGAELRSDEYKLLTRPNLIGSANYVDDKRETGMPASQGTGNTITSFSLGVQQQTDFGLSGSLTYNYTNYALQGTQDPPVSAPSNYITGPVLELQYALWRNGWGRETRATQEQIAAQAMATKFAQSFKQTQLLAEAEVAYWNLSIVRERVLATKDAVERAKRQQQWTAKRQRSGLGDRSDLLQANAAMLQRELELRNALDNERTVARAFNTVRGLTSDTVPETLPALNALEIDKLQVPARVEFRDDVKAAEQQKRLIQANSRLGTERNQPTLNLVGTLGLNGRDPSSSESISESSGTTRANYAVGVRLNMPLDLSTLRRDREGYAIEANAADLNYQRTVYEQERLWTDFSAQFKDSVERYKLVDGIEKAQNEKLEYERIRHRRGRTTTALLIQFESELAASQFARLQAQTDVLNAYARLKTFGGGQ